MTCPHSSRYDSTPDRCSQCLASVPIVFEISPAGRVLQDGVDLGSLAELNKIKYHVETNSTKPRKWKSCANCGNVSHTSLNCTKFDLSDEQEL